MQNINYGSLFLNGNNDITIYIIPYCTLALLLQEVVLAI